MPSRGFFYKQNTMKTLLFQSMLSTNGSRGDGSIDVKGGRKISLKSIILSHSLDLASGA